MENHEGLANGMVALAPWIVGLQRTSHAVGYALHQRVDNGLEFGGACGFARFSECKPCGSQWFVASAFGSGNDGLREGRGLCGDEFSWLLRMPAMLERASARAYGGSACRGASELPDGEVRTGHVWFGGDVSAW